MYLLYVYISRKIWEGYKWLLGKDLEGAGCGKSRSRDTELILCLTPWSRAQFLEADSHLAGQETPRLLWKPKVLYCVQMNTNNMYKFSSYPAVNTLFLGYNDQQVNAE
jgi:hypothetical protein